VLHLAALVPGEQEHCARITALAAQLFEGTRHLSGLSEEAEEWLEAAAILQNVGLVISHDRHHLHSYYVIRNSELLTGFMNPDIFIFDADASENRGELTVRHALPYSDVTHLSDRIATTDWSAV
jgi:exopolyphosphatase/guanosine-5'-triphosphate,3'-diphosphate pyrophosphatase